MLHMAMVIVAGLLVLSALMAWRDAPSSVLRLWVNFGQVATIVSLVPWPLLALLAPMVLTDGHPPRAHVAVGLIRAYPVIALASLGASWWLWRLQREGAAVIFAVVVPLSYALLAGLCCP